MDSVTLTEEAAERLRHGFTWARREDVVEVRGRSDPGAPVELRDPRGEVVALGDVDLEAPTAVRRLALPDEDPQGIIPRHLRSALQRRLGLVDDPRYCRLVHDDADGLPGLLVDRYDRHYVMQATTRPMEARAHMVARILADITQADSVLLRFDGPGRHQAGLKTGRPQVLIGTPPRWTRVLELGARTPTDLFEGRSAGYPYVLRETRRMLLRLSSGASVLDVRSGIGHLFVHAARAGARRVLAFTGDQDELDLARENIEANGLINHVSVHLGEAPEVLATVDQRFDLVLVDARDFEPEELLRMLRPAMRLTRVGGRLIVAASHPAIPAERLVPLISEACEQERRSCVRLVERSAPPDFPALLSGSFSDALTALALEVN